MAPRWEYELKLASGKSVLWYGASPEDAAQNYAANHPGEQVVGWRWPVVDVIVGMSHPRLTESPLW